MSQTTQSLYTFLDVVILCIASSMDNLSIGVSYAVSRRTISAKSNFLIALSNGLTTMLMMLLGGWVSRFLPSDIATCVGGSILVILGLKDIITTLWSSYTSKYTEVDTTEIKTDHPLNDIQMSYSEQFKTTSTQLRSRPKSSSSYTLPSSDTITKTLSKSVSSSHMKVKTHDDQDGDTCIYIGTLSKDSVDMTMRIQSKDINDLSNTIISNHTKVSLHTSHMMTLTETCIVALALCFTNIASGIAAGLAHYDVTLMSIVTFVCSYALLWIGSVLGDTFGPYLPDSVVSLISGGILILIGVMNLPII